MAKVGVFDVLGPIMVGPSSSHTAGAVRLGNIAKAIAASEIQEVEFLLHGSFGKTYKGHGTDKALVAGIMGFETHDEKLRYSLDIARESGMRVTFTETDLGDHHPNTVKMLITCKNGKKCEVMGSSIGGGNIEVLEINGNKATFSGAYPTIITCHDDKLGTVAKISDILYRNQINIAFVNLGRTQKGKGATMTCEVDSDITETVIEEIKAIEGINKVITINPL